MMKIMAISDIHGGIEYLREAIECFEFEKADQLIILGIFCRIMVLRMTMRFVIC